MSSLSSLYSASTMELMVAAPVETAVAEALTASADRLPGLALRYVANVRPGLKPFFNENVREQRTRRRSTKVHNIIIVQRDTDPPSLRSRAHEMIVQHPAPDDPQITDRQAALLEDGLAALASQSTSEAIRFVSMTSVAAIGDHVLRAEERTDE